MTINNQISPAQLMNSLRETKKLDDVPVYKDEDSSKPGIQNETLDKIEKIAIEKAGEDGFISRSELFEIKDAIKRDR